MRDLYHIYYHNVFLKKVAGIDNISHLGSLIIYSALFRIKAINMPG